VEGTNLRDLSFNGLVGEWTQKKAESDSLKQKVGKEAKVNSYMTSGVMHGTS
jgi:hypothetical protein